MNAHQVFEFGTSFPRIVRLQTKRAAFDKMTPAKLQTQGERVMALFGSTDTVLTNEQVSQRAKLPYTSAVRAVHGLLARGQLVDRGSVFCKSTDAARRTVGRPVPTQLDIFGGAA